MSKPAGVQLRRWFTYMVLLLLFVNVAAVIGSVVIYFSVHGVTATYQPFAVATKKLENHVLLAQRDMFEYLSELADSPSKSIAQLASLKATMEEARRTAPSENTRGQLDEIATLSEQYRIAVEQLPLAMEGSRDWSQIDAIRTTAVRYGTEVADRAAALASEAQEEIRKRNETSALLTTAAVGTFILVLGLSVFVLLVLKRWWKRFQDLILGI